MILLDTCALGRGARLLTADLRMLAFPAVATLDYGRPGGAPGSPRASDVNAPAARRSRRGETGFSGR
jgi:hypothetical protein